MTASHGRPPLADVVIRAGTIYAMTPTRETHRAVALRNGWIVDVSSDPMGWTTGLILARALSTIPS